MEWEKERKGRDMRVSRRSKRGNSIERPIQDKRTCGGPYKSL